MPDDHIEECVRENLRRGYTPDSIKEMVRVSGYDPAIVDKIANETSSGSSSRFQSSSSTNSPQSSAPVAINPGNTQQGNANTSSAFQNMGFIEKSKMIIFNPKGFFEIMPQAGGYKDPLMFGAITIVILTIISSALDLALYLAQGKMIEGITSSITSLIVGIIIAPVVLAIALFISASTNYYPLRLLGGKGTYEATFRVTAYSSILMLISWIPAVSFLAGIYELYINVVGFKKVHSMSTGKVLIAMLITIVVIMIIIIIVGAAILGVINGIPSIGPLVTPPMAPVE